MTRETTARTHGRAWVYLWAHLAAHVVEEAIVVYEEPALRDRFGQGFETYRAHVPRWRPRLRPWTSNDDGRQTPTAR